MSTKAKKTQVQKETTEYRDSPHNEQDYAIRQPLIETLTK
jgi:hypothetical protein